MNIPKDLTIAKLHQGLLKKEFRAFELAEAYFDRIREKDKHIGAYLTLMEEAALKTAEGVDIAIAKDEPLAPLAGVPLALKDNILVKGYQATDGSKILAGYTASYDAHVVEKLRSESALFLGKTNLDEFAMGTSTENSGFQITHNPHDLERVPGGSSGGSAAAVGGGMALAALGSDTGGSIRQPAAFCGVVGLKPTYGAVSRNGLIALASSLDQIGPLTRTVEDAAILFNAIKGHDPMDATSAPYNYGRHLMEPDFDKIKDFTVGVPEEYFIPGIAKEVSAGIEEAMERFKEAGVKFKKISLPHTKYALSAYYIIVPAEASSNLARFDGIRYSHREGLPMDYLKDRGAGFGAEPKRRIILGTFVLSAGYYDAYYKKAQQVRALVKQDFENAFEGVDVIFAPTTPAPAFKIGEKSDDPLALYLEDVFTIPINLAGLPSVSIPVNDDSRRAASALPIGFQLIGKAFHEADILGLGRYYEAQ